MISVRERRSVKQKMLQLGGGVEGEVTVSFHKGGHLRQILPAPTGPGKGDASGLGHVKARFHIIHHQKL